MTILITSDWHLNDKPRDRYRHYFQTTLLSLIRKHKAKVLVMLGDLTDDKDRHSSVLVNEVISHLTNLAAVCEVYILRGNHDCIDPNNPFFAFTHHLENIHWIGVPKLQPLDGVGTCLFLPHTRDWERDWERQGYDGVDLIFTHNTFTGARSSSNRTLEGVPVDAFPRGLTAISGDVHVPQDVGGITYVGSPYTIDFGDSYNPRMLLLDDGKMFSIPCPGPQKRLILAQTFDGAKKRMLDLPYDMIKVRVNWEAKNIDKWLAAKRGLLEWAADKKVTLVGVEPILESLPLAKKKYKATTHRTDAEVLADYCKATGTNQVLTKVGMDLLKE